MSSLGQTIVKGRLKFQRFNKVLCHREGTKFIFTGPKLSFFIKLTDLDEISPIQSLEFRGSLHFVSNSKKNRTNSHFFNYKLIFIHTKILKKMKIG